VLTRGPSDREVESLSAFARRAAGRFKHDIDAAKKVAGKTANRPAECATWTAVARALLSLDETITRN
jgi:hypothetical protein